MQTLFYTQTRNPAAHQDVPLPDLLAPAPLEQPRSIVDVRLEGTCGDSMAVLLAKRVESEELSGISEWRDWYLGKIRFRPR